MNLLTYLAFGLIYVYVDMLAAFVTQTKRHAGISTFCALIWPLAVALDIGFYFARARSHK